MNFHKRFNVVNHSIFISIQFDSIIYYSIFAYWKSDFQYYSDQTGVFHYVGSKLIEFPSSRINSNIEDDLVFKKGEETVWICRSCGYVYVGDEAPKVCPVCAHPQSYFEELKENY